MFETIITKEFSQRLESIIAEELEKRGFTREYCMEHKEEFMIVRSNLRYDFPLTQTFYHNNKPLFIILT